MTEQPVKRIIFDKNVTVLSPKGLFLSKKRIFLFTKFHKSDNLLALLQINL